MIIEMSTTNAMPIGMAIVFNQTKSDPETHGFKEHYNRLGLSHTLIHTAGPNQAGHWVVMHLFPIGISKTKQTQYQCVSSLGHLSMSRCLVV